MPWLWSWITRTTRYLMFQELSHLSLNDTLFNQLDLFFCVTGRGETFLDCFQAWSWGGEGLGWMQRSIFDVWVILFRKAESREGVKKWNNVFFCRWYLVKVRPAMLGSLSKTLCSSNLTNNSQFLEYTLETEYSYHPMSCVKVFVCFP